VSELKWHARFNHGWYAYHSLTGGGCIAMHRFVMDCDETVSFQVDHKDGNGLNNQKGNLRVANRYQQMHNRGPLKGRSLKGVYYRKDCNKYRAIISPNGKRIDLGHFASETEAAEAYDRAAIQYFGEFARLNFPQRQHQETTTLRRSAS
jgi:hypothetical protein